MMTSDEYVADYARQSGVSVAELLAECVPMRCACNQPGCQGWAMVGNTPRAIQAHNELYGPRTGT